MGNLAVFLCLACVTAFCQNSPSGPALFRSHCSSCHGDDARGARGPDLTRIDDEERLFTAISQGVRGTEMAAYGNRLTAAQIRQVMAFLRSAGGGRSPIAGSPPRGETLFWGKAGCGNCHGVGQRGNRVGPDLSRIGRQRGTSYLRESMTAPDAYIVPGFQGVTVVTAGAKTIRGVERALDDFSVVLQDFSGRVYSFDRGSLKSVLRDRHSLMPGYGTALVAAELNDVVAYLSTLGEVR